VKKHYKGWGVATALLLSLLVLSGAGCKKKSVDPFPASDVVAGWQKSGEMRTFKAEDLWQYIDGDSERYIKAGVVSTSTTDYKYKGSVDATVDVYTMSNPEGAKAIFEADPPADAKSVSVGDAARLYGQSLIFRKGQYLVRVVAFTPAPGLADALVALGNAVDRNL
jgi:hypothetical protein